MNKRKTVELRLSMGVWEAEMLLKALDGYQPQKKREEISRQDLTRLIVHQIDEAKKKGVMP